MYSGPTSNQLAELTNMFSIVVFLAKFELHEKNSFSSFTLLWSHYTGKGPFIYCVIHIWHFLYLPPSPLLSPPLFCDKMPDSGLTHCFKSLRSKVGVTFDMSDPMSFPMSCLMLSLMSSPISCLMSPAAYLLLSPDRKKEKPIKT